MRKGITQLASLIEMQFKLDAHQKGVLFLFCGRNRHKLKGLLIGKVDEVTGEIIPTGKRGAKATSEDAAPSDNADYRQLYEECRMQAEEAAREIVDLRRRLAEAELKAGKLEARIEEIRKLTEL